MESRSLKRIDVLRHELKALRFILDHYHSNTIDPALLPPRADFQSEQGRAIYAAIVDALLGLYETQGMAVEGSSAISAAFVKEHIKELEDPVCLILTGQNITPEDHARLREQARATDVALANASSQTNR